MSYREESVYNLIKEEYHEPEKGPMYQSKFNESSSSSGGRKGKKTKNVEQDNLVHSTFKFEKKAHGAMGVASAKPNPKKFLKKGEKTQKNSTQRSTKSSTTKRKKTKLKPSVPKRNEAPVMGLSSKVDFVTENAVQNILAPAKKKQSDEVDYKKKKDFGKVPKYLNKVKQEVEAEYEYIANLQEQAEQEQEMQRGTVNRLLSEEEKSELLEGLKAKWEQVNRQYQTLSFSVDTPAKKQRKEKFEAQLDQIEKDMDKLSRTHVFVPVDA